MKSFVSKYLGVSFLILLGSLRSTFRNVFTESCQSLGFCQDPNCIIFPCYRKINVERFSFQIFDNGIDKVLTNSKSKFSSFLGGEFIIHLKIDWTIDNHSFKFLSLPVSAVFSQSSGKAHTSLRAGFSSWRMV